MKLNRWIFGSVIIGTQVAALAARGADDSEVQALKQQLQALDQKVRILERERENDQDAATAKASTAPKVTLGANGFSFASADTNFVAQLHGLVQLDERSFFQDGGINGNDGFLLRRARPILQGTVFRDFDYQFTPDFGGSTVQIVDAYLNYRYAPGLQLQAGKFKSPVGLEALQSDPVTAFNERSIVTDLVANRDLGVALKGDVLDGRVSYVAGFFNGSPDYAGSAANISTQDAAAAAGRLFFTPWKNSDVDALRGLGFGVGGSYETDQPATNSATGLTGGYTTDGQQKFFSYSSGVYANGTHWRVSPQAYYYYGPFGLLAEYVVSDQQVSKPAVGKNADIQNTAWEVTGSWILTGETAGYSGFTPLHPFDPRKNQWGAWQLVARYGELNVDNQVFAGTTAARLASPTASANGAQAWSVGVNWFLNKNLRANLSFSRTTFSGFTGSTSAGLVPAQPENVLFSRLQLAF
jgi:phosphate-selective porin OprO and OprP